MRSCRQEAGYGQRKGYLRRGRKKELVGNERGNGRVRRGKMGEEEQER